MRLAPGNPAARRDLFPHASEDAPLRVHRPRRTIVRARPIARTLYLVSGVTGALAILMTIGPGDSNLTDLFPEPVADAYWTGTAAILGTCLVIYVCMRVLHRGLRRSTRVAWNRYAAERGLRRSNDGTQVGELPAIGGGHTRSFPALYEGRLASCDVLLGATKWHRDSGDDETTHRAFFVATTLPSAIAARWRGTSVTRYFHGSLDFDLDLDLGEELRLESWSVDIDCAIEVFGADADDVRWRELFDPILLDVLAEHVEIQWLQVGTKLVAVAGGGNQAQAPVDLMDTLCTGIEHAVRAFERAAVGDVQRAA